MSDVENDINSQPPDKKDGHTTPDGIGENVFLVKQQGKLCTIIM